MNTDTILTPQLRALAGEFEAARRIEVASPYDARLQMMEVAL